MPEFLCDALDDFTEYVSRPANSIIGVVPIPKKVNDDILEYRRLRFFDRFGQLEFCDLSALGSMDSNHFAALKRCDVAVNLFILEPFGEDR